MKVMVTGCAGFIGSRVAGMLIEEGAQVVGVDCFLDDLYPSDVKRRRLIRLLEQSPFQFEQLDLRRDPLDDLLASVDVVVHEAALPGLVLSWDRFQAYQDCNLLATQRVLEAIVQNENVHLVHASTSSVYGVEAIGDETIATVPISPYGVTKLAAENLIQAYRTNYGIKATVLRYFSVYGAGQRPDMAYAQFCERLLRGDLIPVTGNGKQSRSNTHIDDIARATLAACTVQQDGVVANICGSDEISVMEVISILGDELGVTPRIEFVSMRPGDQARTRGDWRKAKTLLGWSPMVPIEQGLRAQARAAVDAFNPSSALGIGNLGQSR